MLRRSLLFATLALPGFSLSAAGFEPGTALPLHLETAAGAALALSPGAGALRLDLASATGCLSLRYRSDDADGQRWQACLELDGRVLACLDLPPSRGAWTTALLCLPGVVGAPAFPGVPGAPLNADHLRLRAAAVGTGALNLDVEAPKLDGQAGLSPAVDVARAFGVGEADVEAVRALDLPESLGWALLKMQAACACPLDGLLQRRATLTWGEVAASAGLDWGALNREVWASARAAGLKAPDAPPSSLRRAGDNHAFGARP